MDTQRTSRRSFLPPPGSTGYHLLLGAVAIFVLGPLGGITAAFMNFKLGFFVGGQVLAGILGSAVTFGYGADGKHGANYIQTLAASVAGMSAMAVLIQAMAWLGLPEPPVWQLIIYFMSIGMFGVGIGMLYTPILVDRLQLTYPSGLAVANILRALTDKRLLKRSIGKLGAGTGFGYLIGIAPTVVLERLAEMKSWLAQRAATGINQIVTYEFSAANFGAGMIVGARIGVPALVIGVVGDWLTGWTHGEGATADSFLVSIGWLKAGDPFRKIGFLVALASIMGAAIVDLTLIFRAAAMRYRERANATVEAAPDWKRTNMVRLLAWVGFWGVAVVLSATLLMDLPVFYVLVAIGLVFLFVMVNGISQGITDQNPISSAFVVCVLLLGVLGLKDPGIGLMAAAILLISCSVGCDMQQDRSTGWRLGTNRIVQFRYQVIGICMGAVLAVAMAKLFMSTNPVLAVDLYANPNAPGHEQWQSAMTFKFVGALRSLEHLESYKITALGIGLVLGLVIESIRKVIFRSPSYQAWKKRGVVPATVDFFLDAVLVPSPYAASFGGFVSYWTALWQGAGGIASSTAQWLGKRMAKPKTADDQDLPEDMSTTSLVGGGLIAGDSLAALTDGLRKLLAQLV